MFSNLTSQDAADLAVAYSDVMRMVRERSCFHLQTDVGPTEALSRYLEACKRCGVALHNDVWLREARVVAVELTRKRAVAYRRLFQTPKETQS